MSKVTHAKLIIIGSGPAGWTAAIYAARAMLEPILIRGIQAGGQLTTTTDVENYPGFAEVIQGPWLMEQMESQAAHVGTRIVGDHVTKVDLSQRPFRLECDSGDVYLAEVLVLATGAQARWLGIPSEQKFQGGGVSACATCDGFFFRDREIAVVGGGDSAMEEANYLTKYASKVHLLHRRDGFRASKIMIDRTYGNPKIEVHTNTAIDEVLGEAKVEGLRIKDTTSGELRELPLQGLFIAIGHKPNTDVFSGWLETDDKGYLVAHDHTASRIPGVFIAGDVQDHRYRQAITAAGDGARAAIDAEKWLESEGIAEHQTATAW
jgi:thioredoxin reductase (NADPH)